MDALLVDAKEVSALVRETFAAPEYRPPMLPASAIEVHRLSKLPEVDFESVVAVLEKDPMLASDALRVAQSPMFAARVPTATLLEAVSRMGLSNISSLAFQVAMGSKVFRAQGYTAVMDSVRLHSVAAGHVARLIARGRPVADYAFLCGLLHDVGMTAILIALGERKVAPEALVLALADLHEEAGATLLRAWGLPASLEPALAAHHAPAEPAGALARVADSIATDCGFGIDVGGLGLDNDGRGLDRACEILKLGPVQLEGVRAEARTLLEAL